LKILFACSWLDIKSKRGWFFVEQAGYLKQTYPIIEIYFLRFERLDLLKYLFTLIWNKKKAEVIENKFNMYRLVIPNLNLENYIFKKLTKFFIYQQYRRIKREFDIIHAQSFFDAGIYTHWLSRKFKIKSVLTEHNQLNFLDSKFNRKTIKNALNSFDTRIAVSNDVVRQFASTGFFNDFAVIGNPLDDVFLEDECVSTKTECDNQVVLVHAGAFTSIKNQTLILDLIKKLDNDGLKVKFNWIGVDSWGVDTRKVVKIEIDGRQYSDNIEICVFGRMSKQQMLEIYKSSHLAIATSICETFGISSLEAMSTGLPLLSTQNGGVSEFANSENSILVPINDINGLYKGFMKWYNNRNNFDKKRIADNIKQNFSPQLFAEKMNNIYNR